VARIPREITINNIFNQEGDGGETVEIINEREEELTGPTRGPRGGSFGDLFANDTGEDGGVDVEAGSGGGKRWRRFRGRWMKRSEVIDEGVGDGREIRVG
jgi:hypothetical protein